MYSLLEKLSLVGDSFLHYPPLSAYKKPRVSLPVTYHFPLWKKERTKQAFERRSWSQDGAASAREWWHVWQQQNVMQSKSCSILVWTMVNQIIQHLRLLFGSLKDGLYPSKKHTTSVPLCSSISREQSETPKPPSKGKAPTLSNILLCRLRP